MNKVGLAIKPRRPFCRVGNQTSLTSCSSSCNQCTVLQYSETMEEPRRRGTMREIVPTIRELDSFMTNRIWQRAKGNRILGIRFQSLEQLAFYPFSSVYTTFIHRFSLYCLLLAALHNMCFFGGLCRLSQTIHQIKN